MNAPLTCSPNNQTLCEAYYVLSLISHMTLTRWRKAFALPKVAWDVMKLTSTPTVLIKTRLKRAINIKKLCGWTHFHFLSLFFLYRSITSFFNWLILRQRQNKTRKVVRGSCAISQSSRRPISNGISREVFSCWQLSVGECFKTFGWIVIWVKVTRLEV